MTEIEELVTAVNGLRLAVRELSERADTQQAVLQRIERVANDTRRNRVGLQVGTVGVALSLIVGGFAVYLFTRVNATAHQVQEVQARTSSEILCPLYQVFALSIKINPPPASYNAEQLKLRQHAADTILAGLDKLGCVPE